MTPQTFNLLTYAMLALAAVVFISLYFVTAGYGQFTSRRWGPALDNRVAWTLMEAPVFFVMLAIWWTGGASLQLPQLVFLLLFEVHYFQRSFVFPWLMAGRSRMPVAIVLMGITFNVLNGVLQGGGLYWFPSEAYSEGAAYLLRWNSQTGIALFIAGMAVNLHSDHVIRHLRKPGDTRHYLPSRGLYRYVTSANYFGELVEWTGFALAAGTLVAWVFPIWTAANLVPRAHAIHKRYRAEFGAAVGSRKRIIPFVY